MSYVYVCLYMIMIVDANYTCICMYVYIYTYIHVCIHKCIHSYLR